METVYNLPVYARITLLAALSATGLFLIFNIAPLIYSRRQKSLLKAYVFSLFAGIAVLAAAITPLSFALPDMPANISSSAYNIACYILLLPAVLAVVYGTNNKEPIYFADSGVLILMLPLFSFWSGYAYTLFVLVPWLLFRAVFISFNTYGSLKNVVSPFSVKTALDALDEGILFAGKHGRIEFINRSMRSFLKCHAGGEYDKAAIIWARLQKLANETGRVIEGGSLLLNIDGRALMFTNKAVAGDLREISFADVTEEENLLRQIEKINSDENEIQGLLKELLSTIKAVECEKETLRLKSRLHNTISQRLSILHQYLESIEPSKDLTKIKALILSMLPDMLENGERGNIREQFNSLIASYKLIGVNLIIDGKLLCGGDHSETFLEIVRECSANAVRHGGASEICVSIAEGSSCRKMLITDNGTSASEITEGNGITAMRRLVADIGGTFEISLLPKFTVSVELYSPFKREMLSIASQKTKSN